jgi:Calx-beta domain/FG-GAP-like repeat
MSSSNSFATAEQSLSITNNLQQALSYVAPLLSTFAESNAFWQNFELAFGQNFDLIAASTIQNSLINKTFAFPSILVVEDNILGNALGAFAAQNNTIYLRSSLVASGDIQKIGNTIIEETGHWIDNQINRQDAAGDEGAIFAALVQGQNLDTSTLQALKVENDHAAIILSGETIGVEQSIAYPSGDSRINALLTGYRWTTPTISYSFYSGGSYYGDEVGVTAIAADSNIRSNIRYFLENIIEPLINVDFVEVSDSPTSYGLIRYLFADIAGYAYAYSQLLSDTNQGNANDRSGDIVLSSSYNNAYDSNGFKGVEGSHGYTTMIHETLHAIGLKHPGDYNGGGTGTPPFLPFAEDNLDNSIMSYNFAGGEPSTPMAYDLLALQYLYGAKPRNIGNTTYTFSGVNKYSDGLKTVGTVLADTKLTIWDTGGIDTLDFSALAVNYSGYRFDLNAGGWLTSQTDFNGTTYQAKGGDTSGATYLTTTAGTRLGYGVSIENVVGTTSDDTFYGNDLNNNFSGKGGGDIINGAGGNDVAIYSGTLAQYQISITGTAGVFTVVDSIANRDGADTLDSIESLQFSDRTISLSGGGSPTLFIGDVLVAEGNSGTTNAVFTITRLGTATQPITVNYATANGTAIAGSDFTSTSGTVTLAINEASKTFSIPILGDTISEANETFFVNLSGAVNATIIDAQGKGVISNDDGNFIPNDFFANRTTLTGNSATGAASNVGATGETGEPNIEATSTPTNSVWWTWTATADGTVDLNTIGSNFDTTLGVYTGSTVSNLTTIASNDDIVAGVNRVSQVSFAATRGTVYQIAVDGFEAYTGDVNLALNFIPVAANNNFANRATLTGNSVKTTANNIGATGETGEPDNAGLSNPINSVWWSWTATANGNVTISTAGSDFDTTLGVYTGSSVSALTTIASNDDVENGVIRNSIVNFYAVRGTTYQISVDGFGDSKGSIDLNLNFVSNTIANDFGGDRKADVLWRNDNGAVSLWQTGAAGELITNIVAANVNNSWKIASTADFNFDSKSDILWRNTDGTVAIWQMNGANVTTINTVAKNDNSWKIADTGDFNADSSSDILWRNTDGTVAIWQMSGTLLVATPVVAKIDNSWTIASTGDFNGDSKSDILWRNTNGAVSIWLMNGANILSAALVSQVAVDWKIKGVDDFNADGKADILWRNDTNGGVRLWSMNGTGVSNDSYVAGNTADWKISGAGDFSGDGKADILWRNDNGVLGAWVMNGANIISTNIVATVDNTWKIAAPTI